MGYIGYQHMNILLLRFPPAVSYMGLQSNQILGRETMGRRDRERREGGGGWHHPPRRPPPVIEEVKGGHSAGPVHLWTRDDK